MMAGAQHSHRVFQSSAFTRSPQWHPWLGMLSNGLFGGIRNARNVMILHWEQHRMSLGPLSGVWTPTILLVKQSF